VRHHALARDRLLSAITTTLAGHARVLGAALVGSLARGEGDGWSDIDLWVVADGVPDVRGIANVVRRVEAPHNTRSDASSFAVQYDVDGITVHTDWYVFPPSMGVWPADSRPIVHPDALPWSASTFDTLNADGPRGAAPPADALAGNLMMTPLRVKQLARTTAALVDALTGTDLLAPSELPGWSRLTIACHLRYGAEAMRWMTVDARAGRPTAYYPQGRAPQRPGTLEPRPGESPSDVVRSLRDASDALHETWIETTDWATMLREPEDNQDLGPLPLWQLPLFRFTEVEVHGTDLGNGLGPWSDAFVHAVLPVRLERLLRRQPQAPGAWLLRAHGVRVGDDGEPEVIDATGRDLLAILLGRADGGSFSSAFPGP
jgi:maleylpyruvate isomerase